MGQATCDWLSVLHSPALQPILLAGGVLDVGIEVEVRAHGVAQPVLIGQRAKLWGRLPVTGYLCFTSPPTHSALRCRA